MIRLIFLILLFISTFIASAQENELIYKKIIPGWSDNFEPIRDSSGFAISYHWIGQFNTPSVDIGVWSEISQNILVDDFYYGKGLVVYNSDFINIGQSLHPAYVIPLFDPISQERTILNFIRQLNGINALELPAIPAIVDYPSSTFGQSVFVEFNPLSETNTGLMNFSSPFASSAETEPFKGYYNAVNDGQNVPIFSKPSVVLGDSILISYQGLYHTQTLNETVEFTNWGGQTNIVRTQLNLQTHELTSQQIGSATGSQIILRTEPSKTMSSLFRVGIVRGNNTPISVSGAEVEMTPNDSLYHVYITKELADGETEWLKELYAYNNIAADTLLDNFSALYIRNRIFSIFESGEAIYVSGKFVARAKLTDSLMYRDFVGQDYLYSEQIPYFGTSPEYQNPYAECRIFKLDANNGGVLGSLSYVYNLWGNENSDNFGSNPQKNHLFEVADKLAWVNGYFAQNDTTALFTYTGADGSEQNTNVDFPAGKGSFILWLDTDLNILDHWVIPFQNNTIGGMAINSIIPYKSDTLLIQGSLTPNTSSDLNPFDNTEITTVDTWSSFFAFYSAPEILTNSNSIEKPFAFKLFPNPTTGLLRLTGLESNSYKYIIYDLSGRVLRQGMVTDNETIQVGELSSGMYILSVKSGKGSGTRKFVVE